MANAASVGGGSVTRTDYSGNNDKPTLDYNGAGNADVFAQSYKARTEVNQADFVRANLEAKAIPAMDAASESNLAKINPQLANRIRLAAAELKAQGITIRVTSSYRTFAEQDALYAQGRTKPGSIVTNAKGGQSLHNYGLAVDVVPIVNGQPKWDVPESTWQKIGAAGKRQGLEWGGDWTSFKDRPHFQMTGGKSVSTLLSEYRANGGNLPQIWAGVNSKYPTIGPNTPTTPTNPTTPTAPTSNNLRLGSRGEKVKQLQKDLTSLGYKLNADGVFGPKTDAAVKRFQRDKNLTADGIVGAKTRAAIAAAKGANSEPTLPVPTATLRKGSKGEQVKQLQNALVKLGFMSQAQMNTGPGIFGSRTDSALKNFQRSKGLVADGIYGAKSRAALKTALGGSAPTAPTNPTAPSSASGAKINEILRGTNLAGKGDLIAKLSKQYNIPAELALAMFRKEANFAATGSLAQRNNNPGNIRFVGQAGATSGAGNFARWDSMDKGIEAYFKLLDKGYRSFIDRKDWQGLVNKYAPPVENDSNLYARQIIQWMGEYRGQISG